MKIALAQVQPAPGDIDANITKHVALIHEAVTHNCDAIFFPELSITGYEPTLVKSCSLNTNDSSLDVFQELSDSHHITIGLGVPIIVKDGISISMAIFQPMVDRRCYTKQQLHEDELPFFVRGNKQVIVDVGGIKIAPAICYESVMPDHFKKANELGFDVYVASVAKHEDGMLNALKHYSDMAKQYEKWVVVVNSIGPADNFTACGLTSIIDKQGVIVNQLAQDKEALLVYEISSYIT